MARPTKLTPVRHARIVELLGDGVPFATACRSVGVSASAGYEWLYRGWGTHPDRPPAPVYVAFARAVDAVFPGGFADRYEDEDESTAANERSFADAQSNGETTRGEGFSEFSESVARASAEAEPEFAEGFSDTPRDRARARAREASETQRKPSEEGTRRAPLPWLSQRSRSEISILDLEF
jgi:hypothetical protein